MVLRSFRWLYVLLAGLTASAMVAQEPPVEPLPLPLLLHPAYTLEAPLHRPEQAVKQQSSLPAIMVLPGIDAGEPVEPMPVKSPAELGFGVVNYHGDFEQIETGWERNRVVVLPSGDMQPLQPRIRLVSPEPDSRIVEGKPLTLRWLSSGPIRSVRLYYYYGRCKLAGRSRGTVGELVTPIIPNDHEYRWEKIPWMDSKDLRLRIAGFDKEGEKVAEDEIGLRYKPREFNNIPDNCVAVLKRKQRLYRYIDGVVRRMHLVSTARYPHYTPPMHPGSYDRRRGAMGKVFYKDPCAWSRQYECRMPYWMAITSTGSHGIHATSPPFYHRLGSPASHGCIRQHRSDARILYRMVDVGTPVYVF